MSAPVLRWHPMITPNPKTGRNDFERMGLNEAGHWVHYSDYDTLRQQLAAALAERDRAVNALAFYAVRANYVSRESNCGNFYLASEADKDQGAQARAAIAAGGEETGHG